MREQAPKYHRGIEFFRSSSTGLTGVTNDEAGAQSTYTNLSEEEARSWLAAWLEGKRWIRPGRTTSALRKGAAS